MKIKFAIVSSDSNPYYLDFWPLISKQWRLRFGIVPVLCYVGNDNVDISQEYGDVIRFEPIPDVPISFQAQWVRFFHAKDYGEEVVIISDIDMLPLSKFYFMHQIEDIDDNRYVHLNPCVESYGHLPACYHVAKGRLFREVFDVSESWADSSRSIYNQNLGESLTLPQIGTPQYWFTDELYTHKKIMEHRSQDIFLFLPRPEGQNGHRIDRINWDYDKKLLQQEYYFDAHCVRPYRQNKKLIDPVIEGKPLPAWYRTQLKMKRLSQRLGNRLTKRATSEFSRWMGHLRDCA